ncbi:MAG: sulfotransferase family protein, partial [Terriglobia bacterium]
LLHRVHARNQGLQLRSLKAPDSAPRSAWPVFIVSGARSGSTLLRYILDAHENLACPPESKFIAALWDSLDNPQVMDALRSLGLSTDEVCQKMRPFIDGILKDYAARINKPRWVDKTPGYDRILPFLDKVFEEKVLYIFLVRGPLDSIGSLEEFVQPTTHSADADVQTSRRDGGGRYAWAKYWMRVYERIYVYAKMHPDRSHIVKYEDLVTGTEPVLRGLLDFIGESYSPNMERRAFKKLTVGGFQDTKIFRTWRVHGRSIGKWKKWPVPEAETLWELTQPIASKFGYESPFQENPGEKALSSEDGAATAAASSTLAKR